MSSFLNSAQKLFSYYRDLGEKAMAQVPDEKLCWKPHEAANSLAILVNHMAGNLISRFTDFLDCDGEKPWRNRDAEFDNPFPNRASMMERWNQGWDTLAQTLSSVQDSDLERCVYIRQEGHSVLEAIQRQLAHHAYHVGQMVFLAKMISSEDWDSLSIPRNQSASYNQVKFSKEKERRHFTDEV